MLFPFNSVRHVAAEEEQLWQYFVMDLFGHTTIYTTGQRKAAFVDIVQLVSIQK
jgi:hypothetical protein